MSIASFLGNIDISKLADLAQGAAEINRPGGSLANLQRNRLAQKLMQQQMDESQMALDEKKKQTMARNLLSTMGVPELPDSANFARKGPESLSEVAQSAGISELSGAPKFDLNSVRSAMVDNPLPAPELDQARQKYVTDKNQYMSTAMDAYPGIREQLLMQEIAPKQFSGTLKDGETAFVNGKPVANIPAKTPDWKQQLDDPEYLKQQRLLAEARRPPAPEPTSFFAWDKTQKANRRVTNAEANAAPENFDQPHKTPEINLYDTNDNLVGTGDPNDPAVQAKIQSGEVKTKLPKHYSQSESLSAAFANDAITSEINVAKAQYELDAAGNIKTDKAGKPIPSGIDPTSTGGSLSQMNSVFNSMASPAQQRYNQAMSNWGMAVKRHESGAAVSPAEGLEYAQTFFPRFGETDASVIAQKKAQRNEKIQGMIVESNGYYGEKFEKKNADLLKGLPNADSVAGRSSFASLLNNAGQ